jgi:hypothetical protein
MTNNSSLYSPQYTSLEEVKLELEGKINFDNVNPTAVSDNEVLDNIEDGEAAIELKLSRQYLTPFVGWDAITGMPDIPFDNIVPKSTIKYITKLCLLKTCILIMQTVFGKSEGVRGSTYLATYEAELKALLDEIVQVDEKSGQYLSPPLPGLAWNPYASWFRPGIPMPRTAVIGIASGSYGNQILGRQPNAVSNWFFRGWGYNCNGYRRGNR